MAYDPQITPNVTLNFVTTPYNPPTTPNVTINFGPESGGGSQTSSTPIIPTQNLAFFMLFSM